MTDLQNKTIIELLELHVDIMKELQARDILRSNNLPTSDFAEYLFCKTFGWKQKDNSNPGFDAEDDEGTRYQIKGRRITPSNKSRQASAIRGFDKFDILAAVLFDDYYQVTKAALIPVAIVRDKATGVKHTNSEKFILSNKIWTLSGVIDVTEKIQATFALIQNEVRESKTD